jgi:hypothetical protein
MIIQNTQSRFYKILFKKVLVLLFYISVSNSSATNYNTAVGANHIAMGNATVGYSDVWSLYSNQANITDIKNSTVSVFMRNDFLNTNITTSAIAFVQPSSKGHFGFSVLRTGNKNYNDNKIGLAYARSFGKMFSAALQLNAYNTRIGDIYGSILSFGFEAAIKAQLSEKTTLGVHLFNPNNSKISNNTNERINSNLRLGISHKINAKVVSLLEIEKNLVNKPIYKAGVNYQLSKQFYMAGGVNFINSVQYAFGFGYTKNNLKIDVATQVNTQLGFSPSANLQYSFGN